MSSQVALLADGRRLHLQHGPIDLIIEATGASEAVAAAYRRAEAAFPAILPALAAELATLRQPLSDDPPTLSHPAAQAMAAACWPYRTTFITPMAAVAGSVADHMLREMTGADAADCGLKRAYVNNGGDIALHLAPGQSFTTGVVADPRQATLFGRLTVTAGQPVRGIATSGWRGRSFSLGVADAVTILARDAAAADAAATIVANAVVVDHPAIRRAPARSLQPDSDLGDLAVTIGVGPLPDRAVQEALDRGAAIADRLLREDRIFGAVLILGSKPRVVGGAVMLGEDKAS